MSSPKPQPPPYVLVTGWCRISRTRHNHWEVYLRNSRSDTMLLLATNLTYALALQMQQEVNDTIQKFHKLPHPPCEKCSQLPCICPSDQE